MIIEWYRELFLFLWKYLGFFGGIVGISVIVSLACFPLYNVIGRIVGMENSLQAALNPAVAKIKETFSDAAERQAAIERLYARFGYHPIMGVRKVLPLFVAIPFLLLTYHMLSGTSELAGVKWLCFSDVSKPDGLLFGFNLLPFVMTGVNLLTVYATPCFNKKDETQAWVIAIFFLVLLYSANAALMIYWTLNQIFNFGRTLCENRFAGARLLASRFVALARSLRPSHIVRMIQWPRLGWHTPVVVLRNYAVLLLCAFLPAMVLIFGHMPDCLDVSIESNRPLTMTVGFLTSDSDGKPTLAGTIIQGCPLGRHDEPVRFYLADGCDTEALRIRLTASDYDYRVESVSLIRHMLFRYKLSHAIEDNTIRCSAPPVFAGVTFPVVRGSVQALKAGLAGLFLLALLGLFAKRESNVFLDWKLSLALAVLCSAFFTVLLPLQTIFTNRDVFDFGLGAIVGQLGLVALVTCAACFAILAVASTSFGRWPHLVFLGFLVYEYLQTGLLSIGAPCLDGNFSYYWESKPMLVDFSVMSLLGLVFLWKSRWIRSHFRVLCWMCIIGIAAMAAVSICDYVCKPKVSSIYVAKSTDNPWNFARSHVAKGIRYSSAGNIIVLVLDSTQSDAAYNAAQVDAPLRAAFSGFTAFNNNVGMHDNTQTGSIGLFTGEYTPKGVSCAEHAKACYGRNSFVTPYLKANHPVYLLPDIIGAFSNRMENRDVQRPELATDSIFHARRKPTNTSLLDVLQLRLVPFFLKKWDLQVMYLGSVVSDGTHEENALYPELAKCPVADEAKPALIFIHTEGTHAPIRYDEFGNRLWTNKNHYRGLCGETHYVFKSVAAYMNDLKRRGIYDKSLIIITADHGCCFATPQLPKLKNLPTRAVPMLWIKPVGAKGDLATTEIPTSHSKLAELLKRARTETITLPVAASILKTELRRFYDDQTNYREWFFDAEGRNVVNTGGCHD